MSSNYVKGLYRLVTVNTTPDRAKRVVGRVTEELKDKYTIQHVANCEREFHCTSMLSILFLFFFFFFYLC